MPLRLQWDSVTMKGRYDMRLINGETSRKMDQEAMEIYGLDTFVLMENAGLRMADIVADLLSGQKKTARISVIVGKGNNGGDGLVMARHLVNKGFDVEIFCLAAPDEFSPGAKKNWQIVEAMGLKHTFLAEARDLTLFRVKMMASRLIVDAIFGSGLKGEITGLAKEVIEILNDVDRPIFAVDIPSGVDADTAKIGKTFVRAAYTVALGLPKIGNILAPAAAYNGKLEVADISFPKALLEEKDEDDAVIDEEWILDKMPLRKADSHKGLYGHVLVAGGSRNMTGSLILAGKGALKTGAGLVTYLMPKGIHDIVCSQNLEAMTFPLPEQADGSLGMDAADMILHQTGNKILVMGMGLSRTDESMALVRRIVEEVNCPLVLDADALIALGEMDRRKKTQHPLIMTPHPGEMAKILGWSIREVQEERIKAAQLAAERFSAVVVLKGNRTIIAAPNGKLLVNLTGNAGMATGGMGDVLSGIIGSLLGQGLDPLSAAALGIYFHGLAGDIAVKDKGEMGLNAGDIVTYLPRVLGAYEEKKKGSLDHVL